MRTLSWAMAGIIGLGLGTSMGVPTASQAEVRYDSSVRRAAIERMQDKLGAMRGSITPESRNVRLTEQMIELLAPIRAKNGVVEAQPSFSTTAPASNVTANSAPLDGTYTASTSSDLANSAAAGSSDARRILATVEKMMQESRQNGF